MEKQDNSQNLEFQSRCRSDFIFFCERVLNLDIVAHHREISQLLFNNRYLLVVIPTGHSKTTLISIAYSLWRLWREKGIEICITSSSLEQSMKIFSGVQYQLESNNFLHSLLPNDRFSAWNKSRLNTSNGNQCYIKPFNSTARGIHPNILIYDDILRENDTPMDQIKDIFWTIFYPRGQIHKCQHIVVGTPQSLDDLYAEIEKKAKEKGFWKVLKKAAVVTDTAGNWIRPMWEERFTLEDLRKIKDDMGAYRFEREYMCSPRTVGDVLYPQEFILNSLDDNLEYSYNSEGIVYIGADFAMSPVGDYNVFTVVDSVVGKYMLNKKEINNPVFIRQIIRFRGSTGQVESITNLHQHFKSARTIADSSGVGAKFIPELRDNQINVTAQDFRPANRHMMLLNLRRLLEQERLVIPNKGLSVPLTNNLIREMSGFRLVKTPSGTETYRSSVKHDDMVISLAMAVKDIGSPRKMMDKLFFGA